MPYLPYLPYGSQLPLCHTYHTYHTYLYDSIMPSLPYILMGIHYAILTILTHGIPLCHTYHTYLWDSTFIAPWLVTDRLRNLIYAQLNASNLHVQCQFKRIDRAQGEYKVVQIQYTYLLTYLNLQFLPSFLPSLYLPYVLTYILTCFATQRRPLSEGRRQCVSTSINMSF